MIAQKNSCKVTVFVVVTTSKPATPPTSQRTLMHDSRNALPELFLLLPDASLPRVKLCKLPLQTTPDRRVRPLCCSPWPFPSQGLLKQHHPAAASQPGTAQHPTKNSHPGRASRPWASEPVLWECMCPAPHTLSRMHQHFSVAFTVRHAMYWPLSPEAIRGRGALSLHGRTSLLLIPTSKGMRGCSSALNQRSLHLPDFNSELRTWAFNCWTRGEHQQISFYERSLLVSEKILMPCHPRFLICATGINSTK